jgi:hypothetical protein
VVTPCTPAPKACKHPGKSAPSCQMCGGSGFAESQAPPSGGVEPGPAHTIFQVRKGWKPPPSRRTTTARQDVWPGSATTSGADSTTFPPDCGQKAHARRCETWPGGCPGCPICRVWRLPPGFFDPQRTWEKSVNRPYSDSGVQLKGKRFRRCGSGMRISRLSISIKPLASNSCKTREKYSGVIDRREAMAALLTGKTTR